MGWPVVGAPTPTSVATSNSGVAVGGNGTAPGRSRPRSAPPANSGGSSSRLVQPQRSLTPTAGVSVWMEFRLSVTLGLLSTAIQGTLSNVISSL
jgi:hypothetical protein